MAALLGAWGGWEVTFNVKEPFCCLQWSPWRDIVWERVMAGELAVRPRGQEGVQKKYKIKIMYGD